MQGDFNRREIKYLLTPEQRDAMARLFDLRLSPDVYPQYLVQSIYYDTDGWDSVRASIEKPVYKEKLRLRLYGGAESGGQLFMELKKKYRGVVGKCRVEFDARALAEEGAGALLAGEDSRDARELAFYLRRNDVAEKAWVAYQRRAYAGDGREDLRVTLDTDIRFRLDRLDFAHPDAGRRMLPRDTAVLEIKIAGGMPLWMSGALSGCGAFPIPFSKYGTCYTEYILQRTVPVYA